MVNTELAAGSSAQTAEQLSDEAQQNGRLTSRTVRSFVVRNGRLTRAQAAALERLLPCWGIAYRAAPISLGEVSGRQRPVCVEIGFGNGDALLAMAAANPDTDFIGIEVHAPGVGHLLLNIETAGLTNIRIIHHDAMEVLENMLPQRSLDRVVLLFPDPWHKKRHHKRRIVQPDFCRAVVNCLKPGGHLHCATDWADYATWMLDVFAAEPRLVNLSPDGRFVKRPVWRPLTRFEQRGLRLGHRVYDMLYQRC